MIARTAPRPPAPRFTAPVNPATGRRWTKAEMVAELTGAQASDAARRSYMSDTAQQLWERVEQRRNRRYTTTRTPGEVIRYDDQADIYGGQFRLVSFDDRTGQWTAEILAPDAHTTEAIIDGAENGRGYLSPDYADRWEQAEAELARREADAGRQITFRFTPVAAYAELF